MLAEIPIHIQAHEVASKAPYGHILTVWHDDRESRDTWLEVNCEEGYGLRYATEQVPAPDGPVGALVPELPVLDGGGDDRKPWLAAYPEGYEIERVEGKFRLRWMRAW